MENTVSRLIAQLYEKHRPCTEGAVADYIPELTRVNHDCFGIAIFTADGHGYAIGDVDQPFTIQSISKAFTYGMILDEYEAALVDSRIGVEPSGDAFNSISLDPTTGRPFNPMINAGAIAASGMVKGASLDERFEKIRKKFSEFAGVELAVDEAVYQSESATGFRNRAIAHLLRNFNMLDDPVRESVEVYFKQCSILVTCRDLAVMGASLANGGVNPLTGERVLRQENVGKVLSVMSSCGMYDYSGEWIFTVGLPAKSGVGGGVLGVLPGQLGVAVFSPRLDPKGNSVRGIRVFRDLSESLNLHVFHNPVIGRHVVRRIYRLSDAGSSRQRTLQQHEAIRLHGERVTVIEMQGDLFFAAVERLVRIMTDLAGKADTFVVDLSRVGFVDDATQGVLLRIAEDLADAGKRLVLVDPGEVLDRGRLGAAPAVVSFHEDIDSALEACENAIIAAHVAPPVVGGLVAFHEFELFAGLSPGELTTIESVLEMAAYNAGTRIITQGDDPDFIYLLSRGNVSMVHHSGNGSRVGRRVAAYGPGVCFGDMAVVGQRKRTADVWAEENCTCYLLPLEAFRRLEADRPSTHAKLVRNLLSINVGRLERSNREIGSLKR